MARLGAVAFGRFGDRHGRAHTMHISVAMIALPTPLLGLLPTYRAVGVAAPMLLVAMRPLQGISVGGEVSSSATCLVDTAPQGRRGPGHGGTCFYIAFVYLPEWLSGQGVMDRGHALTINTALTVLVIPAMRLAAMLGDRLLPRRT